MSKSFTFCSVDEKGLLFDQDNLAVQNEEQIRAFYDSLKVEESFQVTSQLNHEPVLAEVYDSPIVASEVILKPTQCQIKNSYGIVWSFDLNSIIIDEWDRFHGFTSNNIPFVMNPGAQNQFFNQLDEFDDDSFIYNNLKYFTHSYWISDKNINKESYWSHRYKNNETGWDLGEPAKGLQTLLPKLKLPSSRVLVLGGGSGHDAAHFAQQGHHVTQIDISPEAIKRAKSNYGHLSYLKFIEADIFELPNSLHNQFDLIFEHTCFCAIDPNRRDDLVKQWRRLLNEKGNFFGIFFTMPKRTGPPFGASEWEIKHRFKNQFQPLIWQRFRHSINPRLGLELLVYLQKK